MPTMAVQASAIVPLVVQLGRGVSGDEYSKLILDPIIKLFASPDRGTRIALLDNLPEFAPKLDKKMVSDKIWPHLVCRHALARGIRAYGRCSKLVLATPSRSSVRRPSSLLASSRTRYI